MSKIPMKEVDFGEPTSFLDHGYLGCTQRECETSKDIEENYRVSKVCSQIVLKCVCLARIGRPDILWSGNNFARACTKWTRACDKTLGSFDFSYPLHEWLQTILSCGKYCTTNADWDCSRTLILLETLTLKIDFGENLVHFWRSHIRSPQVGCARNKCQFLTVQQNLRFIVLMQVYAIDGMPALDLWDLVKRSVTFFLQPNARNK